MWPGMPGRARRAGACSPQPGRSLRPHRPALCAPFLARFLVREASCISCVSIWSLRADPWRWRALFLPRTPAAPHSTPHSLGGAVVTDPSPGGGEGVRSTVGSSLGPTLGTPVHGGGTLGPEKEPVSGAGPGTAGCQGPAASRATPSTRPLLLGAPGVCRVLVSSPWERRGQGAQKGYFGKPVLTDGDSCTPPLQAVPVLAGVREGRHAGFPASRRATRYFQIKGIPGAPHHCPRAAVGSAYPLSPTGGSEQLSHSFSAEGPRQI